MDVGGNGPEGRPAEPPKPARTPGRKLQPLPAVEPVSSLLEAVAQGDGIFTGATAKPNGESHLSARRGYSAGKATTSAVAFETSETSETGRASETPLPGAVPSTEAQQQPRSLPISGPDMRVNPRGRPALFEEEPRPSSASLLEENVTEQDAQTEVTWRQRSQSAGWRHREDDLIWSGRADDMQPTAGMQNCPKGYLKYGDIISLRLSGGDPDLLGAVLHADGFTDDHVRVQPYISLACQQRECLFEVLPQLMYEAAKTLAKAEGEPVNRKRTRRSMRTITSHEARLAALRTKEREEQDANEMVIAGLGAAADQPVSTLRTFCFPLLSKLRFLLCRYVSRTQCS